MLFALIANAQHKAYFAERSSGNFGEASPKFPDDLSAKYALCCALAMRAKSTTQIKNSLVYLANNSSSEWLNQCTIDIYSILKEKGKGSELIEVLSKNEKLLDASKEIAKLLAAYMLLVVWQFPLRHRVASHSLKAPQ